MLSIKKIKKSLQSQPDGHESQRFCAAATDVTYGPITIATGAQHQEHKNAAPARRLGCVLMGSRGFQRKDGLRMYSPKLVAHLS